MAVLAQAGKEISNENQQESLEERRLRLQHRRDQLKAKQAEEGKKAGGEEGSSGLF